MLTGAAAGSDILSLAAFAAVATVTPGGANLLAAASGVRFGLWRSLPLLAGTSLGLALLVAIAGAGFGALLRAIPALEVAMRSAGSAYLLWLAWRIARSGPPGLREGQGAAPAGVATGIALLWLNPKAWTMALAASATYAGLATSPVVLAATLGAVFAAAAAISLAFWCTCGVFLGRALRTPAQWRAVNTLLGAALAASVIPMWL
jgi:threonine/homoserine/homoserine lactone efflux protein